MILIWSNRFISFPHTEPFLEEVLTFNILVQHNLWFVILIPIDHFQSFIYIRTLCSTMAQDLLKTFHNPPSLLNQERSFSFVQSFQHLFDKSWKVIRLLLSLLEIILSLLVFFVHLLPLCFRIKVQEYFLVCLWL